MKQTSLILISFLFILSSCGPSAPTAAEMAAKEKAVQDSIALADYKAADAAKIIPNFTKSFEGTINGKYGIIMTLTKSGNDLNGTYMYKSQKSSLKLKGSIDNNGNLSLNEFDNKGSMTGTFKGQLTGNNLTGQWSKPDGSKTMPFSVFESSNTEEQLLKEKSMSKDAWRDPSRDAWGNPLNAATADTTAW